MEKFEINGNLSGDGGLEDYEIFESTICIIRTYYINLFGDEFMSTIDLYVDNATQNSGYTPVITPILGKYLIIKLGVSDGDARGKIAYQFAHELMHYAFYVKYGLDKQPADVREESICSAASLIVLHDLFLQDFDGYKVHVKTLENIAYRGGAEIAESVDYDFKKLIALM